MGYFGSIAKQSGLRVAGAKKSPRAGNALKTPRTAELSTEIPIEREEVVMISSEKKASPPSAQTLPKSVSEPEVSAPKIEETLRAVEQPSAPVENAAGEKLVAPFAAESGERTEISPQLEIRLEPEVRPSPEIAETVFTKEIDEPVDAEVADRAADSSSTDSPPPPAVDETPPPKNFFRRTSEFFDGRAAEPAEIQTVLLREIQEWIAAGPAPDIDPVTREAKSVEEPPRVSDVAGEDDDGPAPGVIRIGEPVRERRTETGDASPVASTIEEQSFELSIGTISVTIEGDPARSGVAEIKQTPAPKPAAESPRGPRLSRHYI